MLYVLRSVLDEATLSAMPKGPERREARFTLRLPPSLRDAIERCADKDRRSVSDWIVLALERAVAVVEPPEPPRPVSKRAQ